MSEYTRAIFFKDGASLTITPQEEKTIKAGLLAGGKWVDVQNEFISADNIARIGSHHATAYMEKIEQYQKETDKKIEGSKIKQIEEADYYIDKNTGEKMYT